MAMLTTPTVKDGYTRAIIDMFDERAIIGVPTGGQVWFGSSMNGRDYYESESDVFEYDVIRGTTTIAPMILRGSEAKHDDSTAGIQTEKFTNFPRIFPLIEDKASISSAQITKTMAGERGGGTLTRNDRARILAVDQHEEMIRRMSRTQEYLAWQVILTGQMPCITGTTDSNLIYDFLRDGSHAATPAAAWSNDSTDILGDLDTYWALGNVNAHTNFDVLLCGATGIQSIMKNTAIQGYADNRRYGLMNIGDTASREAQIVRKLEANGYQYLGYITTTKGHKFSLFTYEKFYTLSGTQYYLPANKVVMASSTVRADKIFGPRDGLDPSLQEIADYRDIMGVDISQIPMMANIDMGTQSFNPNWYYFNMVRNLKNYEFFTQTAPVYAPKQTDAWVVITVS